MSVTDGVVMWWHPSAICMMECFDTENRNPKRSMDRQKSDSNNSVSSTCSFDGAPSPSPPARESDWGQSGNRWRSRSRGPRGRSPPARLEQCKSPGGHELQMSMAVDLTACHPSAADTGSICKMRQKGRSRARCQSNKPEPRQVPTSIQHS